MVEDLDGIDGAALGGLLDLTLLFREDLVPGGGDPSSVIRKTLRTY